jgi:hypothetical protein
MGNEDMLESAKPCTLSKVAVSQKVAVLSFLSTHTSPFGPIRIPRLQDFYAGLLDENHHHKGDEDRDREKRSREAKGRGVVNHGEKKLLTMRQVGFPHGAGLAMLESSWCGRMVGKRAPRSFIRSAGWKCVM